MMPWRRLWRANPAGTLGLVLLLLVVVVAVAAPVLAPHAPNASDLMARLRPPGTPGHPLGTDQLGRDELSRIIYGSRISLLIGAVTVLGAGVLGTALGLLAGYAGGWVDVVIMRLVDVQLSFPFVLLALTINAVIGLGLRNIIISLIVSGWVVYARLVRGEVMRIREAEFVAAARVTGASHGRIVGRHILRNVVASLTVLSSLQVAQFILAEAAISFLGFGIQPPTAAWGSMLEEGEQYFWSAPWLITLPGLALLLTALAANLTGDLLRDLLDPRLRGSLPGRSAAPTLEEAVG